MLAKPKQIVVDKTALVSINLDDLCNFAGNHLMLACDTLLYECATTSESGRKNMLSRYTRFIKAGAYFCQCSVTYVQYEGRYSHPYPWFLPDLEATETIRTGKARLEDTLNSLKTLEIEQSRWEVAKHEFLKYSEMLQKEIYSENPDVGKRIKKLPSDKLTRLKMLFKPVDRANLHQTVIHLTPARWINDEAKFCLSPEWMSWQRLRLIEVIVQEYYYLRQKGGTPGNKTAEHDYQDMEYVLLLSRADVLITGDKFVKALSKTAFPKKDVFSSLEEVPEDYKCHWN